MSARAKKPSRTKPKPEKDNRYTLRLPDGFLAALRALPVFDRRTFADALRKRAGVLLADLQAKQPKL